MGLASATGMSTRPHVFKFMYHQFPICRQLPLLDKLDIVLIPVQEPTSFDFGATGEVPILESPLLESFVVGEPVFNVLIRHELIYYLVKLLCSNAYL